MIIGIGTDIVSIARMQEKIGRNGDKLAKRLLTTSEFEAYQQASQKDSFLAKRFAAKEATVKALGTGFAQGITWQQISVGHNEKGAPVLLLSGVATDYADQLGVKRSFLSLSDEQEHAIAFVVLEG